MAIAFNLPSEREASEENFSRLNRLLTELYEVLCHILVSRQGSPEAPDSRRGLVINSDYDRPGLGYGKCTRARKILGLIEPNILTDDYDEEVMPPISNNNLNVTKVADHNITTENQDEDENLPMGESKTYYILQNSSNSDYEKQGDGQTLPKIKIISHNKSDLMHAKSQEDIATAYKSPNLQNESKLRSLSPSSSSSSSSSSDDSDCDNSYQTKKKGENVLIAQTDEESDNIIEPTPPGCVDRPFSESDIVDRLLPDITPRHRSISTPPPLIFDTDLDDDVFVNPRSDSGNDIFATRHVEIFSSLSPRTPAGVLFSPRRDRKFTFAQEKQWRDKGGTDDVDGEDEPDAAPSEESPSSKASTSSESSIFSILPDKLSGSICTAVLFMVGWKLLSSKR